jgi:hypothetical protein
MLSSSTLEHMNARSYKRRAAQAVVQAFAGGVTPMTRLGMLNAKTRDWSRAPPAHDASLE